MTFEEPVVIDKGEGLPVKDRFLPIVLLEPNKDTILERRHLILDGQPVTQEFLYFHQHGERTVSGHRVFRPAPERRRPEPVEQPRYDERHVIFTDEVDTPTIR